MEYAERVMNWWITLTDTYRSTVAGLTEEQRSHIRNRDDYSAPFTVDHIMIEYPPSHLAIISKFDIHRDRQVTIHGPLKWKELYPFLDHLIREPRWNRPLTKDLGPPRPEWASKSLAGSLATTLALAVRILKDYALIEIEKSQFITHTPVGKKCIVMVCVGDILKIDASDSATWAIDKARSWRLQTTDSQAQTEPANVKAFTTVFFPPLTVESAPTWRDFQSLVHKGFLSSWSERILDTTFDSFRIAVQRDGTLLTTANDRMTARGIFNLIFAVSALNGLTVFSVKESELATVQVDPKTLETRVYEGHEGTVFRELILHDLIYREYGFSPSRRQLVSRLQLASIISQAEKVFRRSDIMELLLNWLQAKTFFENSEYGQAFVVAWINIEKDIFRMWGKIPEERRKTRSRTRDGKEIEYPPVSLVLNSLKDEKLIPSDKFDLLKGLNHHRNGFVHEGEEISKEVAYASLALVKLMVDEAVKTVR